MSYSLPDYLLWTLTPLISEKKIKIILRKAAKKRFGSLRKKTFMML